MGVDGELGHAERKVRRAGRAGADEVPGSVDKASRRRSAAAGARSMASRRWLVFLRSLFRAGLPSAMALFACTVLLTGCGLTPGGASREKYTRELFAMDTYVTLSVYDGDGEAALDAAAEEIRRLERLLSTGDQDSEVAVLNREGGGLLSEDAAYLWKRSLEICRETDGAFDVTIYPVMRAWGFADGNFRVPGQAELEELTARVDASMAAWDEKQGRLTLPDRVEVDFGGIAKGYAGDRLAEILRRHGVESALLNLGGNVRLVGCKPDGVDFRIGIRDPEGGNDPIGVLSAADVTVVTSGGYERFFEEGGVTYHHILDPATGRPADKGLRSVTVVCGDGTLADGYSTALFVMGTEGAAEFWRERSKAFDMVLVAEDGAIYVTEGLKGCFSSERPFEVLNADGREQK